MLLLFPTRHDQPRGGPKPGQVLPDAAAGLLPRGTVRDHDDVLEAEAWGAAHFWFSAGHAQWLLHRHRGTIRETALIKGKKGNVSFLDRNESEKFQPPLTWDLNPLRMCNNPFYCFLVGCFAIKLVFMDTVFKENIITVFYIHIQVTESILPAHERNQMNLDVEFWESVGS